MNRKSFYWVEYQPFNHSITIDDASLKEYFSNVGETVACYSLANGYLQEYHGIYLHQIPIEAREKIVYFIRKKYEAFMKERKQSE